MDAMGKQRSLPDQRADYKAGGTEERGTAWCQPQLLTAPGLAPLDNEPGPSSIVQPKSDRTKSKASDPFRQVGLAGVAQARSVLAEASRRAAARKEALAA